MSDTLIENIGSHIVHNETQFLGLKNREKLRKIFSAHRSGGKLKIELGLQRLILKSKEKRKTRNGGEMIVLRFYKPPVAFDGLKNKMAYHTIDCFHILGFGGGKFKDNWYKRFTTCLKEEQFDVVKKGDEFLCLISHEEKTFNEEDGSTATYNKGNKVGEKIVVIEPSIVKVYPLDFDVSSIKINYFELYKEL
jgi:hypothetical protein